MAIIKHEEKEPLWNLAVRGKTVSKQTLETERDRECVMCVCVCVCVCEVTNHIELRPN